MPLARMNLSVFTTNKGQEQKMLSFTITLRRCSRSMTAIPAAWILTLALVFGCATKSCGWCGEGVREKGSERFSRHFDHCAIAERFTLDGFCGEALASMPFGGSEMLQFTG